MERVLTALIYQLDQIHVFGVDRERMSGCIKTLQDLLDVLREGPTIDEKKSSGQAKTNEPVKGETEMEVQHEPNQ